MGNLLIYSAADNFCIWPRALPLPAVARIARAQTYPTRPGRIIVGVSAGGGVDIIARLMGSMAVGAAWPATRHREPAGRRRQYWHRGGGAGTRGWLYAPPGPCVERNQRDALSGVAPAVTDLLGGQVQVVAADLTVLMAQIEAGTAVPIGAAADQRNQTIPEVPTLAEQGYPNTDASNWYALLAPAKTPPTLIKKLNDAANSALADPDVRGKIVKSGAVPVGGTPDSLGVFMRAEYDKWGRVVREHGIKETP